MTYGEKQCLRCGQSGHVSASCPQPVQPATHVISVVAPIRIESEANRRDHYMAVARRKREQAHAVGWVLRGHRAPAADALTVTLTRIGARALDSDNLAGGFKATRDAVARWLGIDDGSSRIEWRYAQRTGKPREYAAAIDIEWTESC